MRRTSEPHLVLILGGTSGGGLEIARRLTRDRFHLHLIGNDSARLARVAESISRPHPPVTHKIDLGNEDACYRLIRWIDGLDMPIARLVTFSPETDGKPFLDQAPKDFRWEATASECRFFSDPGCGSQHGQARRGIDF